MLANFKEKLKSYENDIVTALVIILVALIGFGLGRLSVIREEKTPIRIEGLPAATLEVGLPRGSPTSSRGSTPGNEESLLVASKNSDKYHYPWCPGALRIKEENKIWFSSKQEAEKAGYLPAANCQGL